MNKCVHNSLMCFLNRRFGTLERLQSNLQLMRTVSSSEGYRGAFLNIPVNHQGKWASKSLLIHTLLEIHKAGCITKDSLYHTHVEYSNLVTWMEYEYFSKGHLLCVYTTSSAFQLVEQLYTYLLGSQVDNRGTDLIGYKIVIKSYVEGPSVVLNHIITTQNFGAIMASGWNTCNSCFCCLAWHSRERGTPKLDNQKVCYSKISDDLLGNCSPGIRRL